MKLPPRHLALALALALVQALLSSASAEEEKVYLAASETEALMAREGEVVVVHGEVSATGRSASGMNFVNFEGAEFSLVAFKSDLGQFPQGEPADLYEGRRLAVEGIITLFRGKPQIKLTEPRQVKVLDPDAVFPPPAMAKPVASADPEIPQPAGSGEGGAPAPTTEEPRRKPPVDPSEYFKVKPKA
jgi:hypothetical protein